MRGGAITGIVATAVVLVPVLVLVVILGTAAQADAIPGAVGVAGQLRVGAVPARWAPYVAQAGATCPAVSPALVAAQVEQESGWNTAAVSPAGARGLAQLLPATATAQRVDPADGASSILAMGRIDCANAATVGLLPGDRTSLMLAAYNAGLGAVLRFGGVPPYAETQTFVRAILAGQSRYTAPVVAPVSGAGCTRPISGAVLTQHFGAGPPPGHPGVDLAAGFGTPVVAACAGVVTFAGPAAGYGEHFVQVDMGGFTSAYGHMSAQAVTVGQRVAAGQLVGAEGSEGYSTGPHLHFEVRSGDAPWGPVINPETFLTSRGVSLP